MATTADRVSLNPVLCAMASNHPGSQQVVLRTSQQPTHSSSSPVWANNIYNNNSIRWQNGSIKCCASALDGWMWCVVMRWTDGVSQARGKWQCDYWLYIGIVGVNSRREQEFIGLIPFVIFARSFPSSLSWWKTGSWLLSHMCTSPESMEYGREKERRTAVELSWRNLS